MTIIKKKIGLGVLAAVSVAAVPIATVISCGKNNDKKAGGTISEDFNIGMPLTWNIMNADNSKVVNAVMENSKKADALAKQHNWKVAYEDKATIINREQDPDGEQKKKDSERINKKKMAAIEKLTPIQKRSMVISATDIDTAEIDATSKYKITIYTTINDEKDISPELKRFMNLFLSKSQSQATSFNDYENLDKVKPAKNEKLRSYSMKRYLSAARSMRNFGGDEKSVYNGEAFYDNGFYTPEKYKEFTDEVFFSKNPLAKVIEPKNMKHLDVSSTPSYNVQQGEFIQNITFYEGVKFEDQQSESGKKDWKMSVPGWSTKPFAGHTPEYKGYKEVFTMSPLIQKFGDATRFEAEGFTSISDDELVDYVGMIHEIMYKLSDAQGSIVDGLNLLRTALPNATPFILTNQDWCRALDQLKASLGQQGAVDEIKKLVRNNISEIRKTIKDKNTISEARLEYAYFRDHNKETLEGFHGSSEHWDVRQEVQIKTSQIVGLFDLKNIADSNTQVLSMLFDYINTLYSLGNILTDLAFDAELIE